jgi:hypothetical protein
MWSLLAVSIQGCWTLLYLTLLYSKSEVKIFLLIWKYFKTYRNKSKHFKVIKNVKKSICLK